MPHRPVLPNEGRRQKPALLLEHLACAAAFEEVVEEGLEDLLLAVMVYYGHSVLRDELISGKCWRPHVY